MDFAELIRKGAFDKMCSDMCNESSAHDIFTAIMQVGIVEQNILGYYACIRLLQLNLSDIQKSVVHNECAVILSIGINFVEGAYALGFYHAKKAIEHAPQNLKYKEMALNMFAKLPDFDMDDDERRSIARDILQMDPNNATGLKYQY